MGKAENICSFSVIPLKKNSSVLQMSEKIQLLE